MNPNILREALLVATYDPGPDAPEPPPVRVEEWAGRRVVIIGGGDVPGDTPIWRREALLRAMIERGGATLPTVDPALDLAPIPPAALAAFDVPGNHKKNRAQRRKEPKRNGR